MRLLINADDGMCRHVLDDPLAGSRLPDLVARNLSWLGPVDARLLGTGRHWIIGHTNPEPRSDGNHVLLVDADVWLSQRALEQLLSDVSRGDLPAKVTLPATPPVDVPGSPDVVALYLPASVAPSFLMGIGDGAFPAGVGAAGQRLGGARTVDANGLDADDPPLRVTGLADLAILERRILHQRALAALDAGIRIRDPHQVAIRGELHCGANVEIDLQVIVEGSVTLGEGVHVGAHSILIDSTIGPGSRIRPYSFIEEAQIGANNTVGPYGRVRSGTVTGDEVQIGHFVEIKNAEVGFGSRINHLSFVGDATVGRNVTLGAATITCNHNRVGPVRSIIGDGAYVGSGTELVAPVVVGEDATIGAGSTITVDVPAGTLALARQRQVSVPGWQPPAPGPFRP